MNTKHIFLPLLILATASDLVACANAAPNELVHARQDYESTRSGSASKSAPAEVHVAGEALAQAEKSFKDDGDTYRTRDLAYVAQRKSAMANATAEILRQKGEGARANEAYTDAQGNIIADRDADLARSRDALADSQRSGERTSEALSDEKRDRAASEERSAEELAQEKAARQASDQRASDALAKLAAVKADPRGTVITLSGSVLFASNKSALLPAARTRLEQVADVLLADGARKLVVEGHTDSKGSDTNNLVLSRSRADAVRDGLIARGYDGKLIEARGMGEANPIADNGESDGRANNRRVEIIISPRD